MISDAHVEKIRLRLVKFAIKISYAPNSALKLSEAHESSTMVSDVSERVSTP